MFGSHRHAGADHHLRDRADHLRAAEAARARASRSARASPSSRGPRTSCRTRSRRKSGSRSSGQRRRRPAPRRRRRRPPCSTPTATHGQPVSRTEGRQLAPSVALVPFKKADEAKPGPRPVPDDGGRRSRRRCRSGRRRRRRRAEDVVPRAPRRAPEAAHPRRRRARRRLPRRVRLRRRELRLHHAAAAWRRCRRAASSSTPSRAKPSCSTSRSRRSPGCCSRRRYVMLQVWLFIAPGLYANEKKLADPVRRASSTGSSSRGAAFSHYIVVPADVAVLRQLRHRLLTFMPRIEPAFSLYVKMLLAFGLIFQMPTLVFFLARMGLVTAGFLVRNIQVRRSSSSSSSPPSSRRTATR